jgi:serine/threonine protein kinase
VEGIADYRFLRSLGEGNHGEFFLAEAPPRLGLDAEHVVVKVLHPQAADDAFKRATRELRAFAAVRSPHLVVLYDAGQEGVRLYYAMEYLPLGSLGRPARPVPPDAVLRAVADAARAAHALHEGGIAHRDIRPDTVLLTETGGKLSDLGLAAVLNPGQTVTAVGGLGSIEFMDPAVLRGGSASRAADIWALGVTLHRAVAGVGVYGELPEREPLLAIRKVLSSSPTLDPGLEPAVKAVVERCLRPDPAERYPTAAEVAADLDALEEQR